jgi:hypothetical protein
MVLDPGSLIDAGNESPAEIQGSIQEASRETLWGFVVAALFAHAGLFAASLGLMLGYFRDQWALGGTLFAFGLVALAITVGIYRWHKSLD